jgi:hypothetical protein
MKEERDEERNEERKVGTKVTIFFPADPQTHNDRRDLSPLLLWFGARDCV